MGPYVRQVVESGAFPLFNRSVLDSRTAHLAPEERFRYGLDRILDAIAALTHRSVLVEQEVGNAPAKEQLDRRAQLAADKNEAREEDEQANDD
jgi:hypothetical protein